MKLFESYTIGKIQLKNRIVMAPMTRCRAIGNIPNEHLAKYYKQRASAGLIITEGTAPSPNGLGYARIPGIYSKEQTEAWKLVTDAVHESGGKIFVQIMHTGRVSHLENMPEGAEIVAPSALALKGEMYTDSKGSLPYPVPKEMDEFDIEKAQNEYVQASQNAIEAGFDGIELHAANGYLLEQFINPKSNKRTDKYGDSIENRARFVLETVKRTAEAIGADRIGIRLSPYGVASGMGSFDGIEESFEYIAKELGKLSIAYIHLVDHSAMGAPEVPESMKTKIRNAFGGTIILCGGMDKQKGETILKDKKADLIAFGRPFISNADLVNRIKNDYELAEADQKTFYSPGEKGYTDYPNYSE